MPPSKADPGEVLDVLMDILSREALYLRDHTKAPLNTLQLDVVAKMASAVAKIEHAMRQPLNPAVLSKLTEAEIRDKIRELEAKAREARAS